MPKPSRSHQVLWWPNYEAGKYPPLLRHAYEALIAAAAAQQQVGEAE